MYLIFLCFFTFIFSEPSINKDTLKIDPDYFKNFKLKELDMDIEDLISKTTLKLHNEVDKNILSENQIDSIRLVSKNRNKWNIVLPFCDRRRDY